jgi:hypothetical protein
MQHQALQQFQHKYLQRARCLACLGPAGGVVTEERLEQQLEPAVSKVEQPALASHSSSSDELANSCSVCRTAPTDFIHISSPAIAPSRGSAAGSGGDTQQGRGDASFAQQLLTSHTALQVHQPYTAAVMSSCDEECPEGQQCYFYDWKWDSKICYVRSGSSGPVLLLCHGFGVGVHHFEDNIPTLAESFQVRPSFMLFSCTISSLTVLATRIAC